MENLVEQAGRLRTWSRAGALLGIGSIVLLLVLIAALLLPGGTLFAAREHGVSAMPASAPHAVAAANTQPHVQAYAGAHALALDGGVPAEPALPDMGGACIEGSVIDLYHQVAGVGWPVTISDDGGNIQSATVDSAGEFRFEEQPGGTWTVELEIPDGWRKHTPDAFQVTLSGEGAECAKVRFKVEALACLEVVKLDAEHALAGDAAGLQGWTITITSGEASITEATDGQGWAYFYDLAPGTWVISEEAMVGWQPATGHGYEKVLTLKSPRKPGVCEKLEFLNEQVHDGCIRVKKTDPVGLPLKGWRVTVARDDGTQPSRTAYTDLSGYATFTGLELGSWTVTETAQDGWRAVGATEQSVIVEVPGYCEPVSFSNEPLGCVDGYKINDLGQALKDWEITATNEDTGEELTVATDEDGYFRFKDLTLGIWTVSEVLQQGWEAVTPSELLVDVKEPFVCEHVRFKNRTRFACVDVFKVDSYDGVGLPGWEITIQPAYGGEAITGETDGVGWVRFNGLVPGTYKISEVMQPGWTADTSTSQKIKLVASGSCSVVTFKNHQKTAPLTKPDPPAPARCCSIYHTVRWGDTLYSVADRYGTSARSILRCNRLCCPNQIYVGRVLCIP